MFIRSWFQLFRYGLDRPVEVYDIKYLAFYGIPKSLLIACLGLVAYAVGSEFWKYCTGQPQTWKKKYGKPLLILTGLIFVALIPDLLYESD